MDKELQLIQSSVGGFSGLLTLFEAFLQGEYYFDKVKFFVSQEHIIIFHIKYLRVEFVNILNITERFRGKIENMKRNFARVDENFQIGIDSAAGNWGYWPTKKYTHVIYFYICLMN